MLVRKVKELTITHTLAKRYSPQNCVVPSCLEPKVVIENLELSKNYFQHTPLETQGAVSVKKQRLEIPKMQSMMLNKLMTITPINS